jgi:hypothetical protein
LYRTLRDKIWNCLHQRKNWRRVSAPHYLCVLIQVGNKLSICVCHHICTMKASKKTSDRLHFNRCPQFKLPVWKKHTHCMQNTYTIQVPALYRVTHAVFITIS